MHATCTLVPEMLRPPNGPPSCEILVASWQLPLLLREGCACAADSCSASCLYIIVVLSAPLSQYSAPPIADRSLLDWRCCRLTGLWPTLRLMFPVRRVLPEGLKDLSEIACVRQL